MYYLLTLLLAQVTCDIQRFDNGGFKAEFSVMNKGRVHLVFQYFEDHTLQHCIVKCIMHLNCVTINYNSLTSICELVDQNFDSNIADLNSTGWTSYGTPSRVDGGFSDWLNTTCTVTCGNGTIDRYRKCTNPTPQYGGRDCQGETFERVHCEPTLCIEYKGTYQIFASNYPDHRFAEDDKSDIVLSKRDNHLFKIIPALNGVKGAYSFEAAQRPTYYFTHEMENLRLDKTGNFTDYQCYFIREKHFINGYVAFEACNRPGHFVMHSNFKVMMVEAPNSPNIVFLENSSFKLTKYSETINCEGETMNIRCVGDNMVIKIKKAWYGRSDKTTCPDPKKKTMISGCIAGVNVKVRDQCDLKEKCEIQVRNWALNISDPCRGYIKFLVVYYTCAEKL